MTTLLLDTSGTTQLVALADGTRVLASLSSGERAQHLLALVDELRSTHDRPIERIAVGVGPGSFTGLRVGVATARGLATAWHVPLAAVDTLAVVAQPEVTRSGAAVWAVLDGGRGEKFMRRYVPAGDTVEASGDVLTVPVAGVEAMADGTPIASAAPTADGLAAVAASLFYGEPQRVLPEYGRLPDAKPARGVAAGGRT
jgi:tRNA threonylcarbamoyl adenosine modification protein YeaZ